LFYRAVYAKINSYFCDRSAQTISGDENDLIRIARQCLNKTCLNRIISKQECMVECTELPLTLCSDNIEVVSLTNSVRLSTSTSVKKTLVQQYESRCKENQDRLSYSEFAYNYYQQKQSTGMTVLHFVGMNNTPSYPVTSSYARCTLILHIPWREFKFHKMSDLECIALFNEKMTLNEFPRSVKLQYEQVLHRYQHEKHSVEASEEQEPESSDDDSIGDDLDDEDALLLKAVTRMSSTSTQNDGFVFNQGLNYDWSKRFTVSYAKITVYFCDSILNR
jgi:hypothetical protein